MTTVIKKRLPHGRLPFETIRDTDTRKAVMKLNENIKTLAAQLKTAQEAILELQRRK